MAETGMHSRAMEFVPAVFARDAEEAERYRTLLESGEIPSQIGDAAELRGTYTSLSRSIPVRVPELYHDQATELIAAYENALACNAGHDDEDNDDDDDWDDEDDEEDDEEEDEEDDDDDDDDDLEIDDEGLNSSSDSDDV